MSSRTISQTSKMMLQEKTENFSRILASLTNPDYVKIAEKYQSNFHRLVQLITTAFGRVGDAGFSTKDMPTISLDHPDDGGKFLEFRTEDIKFNPESVVFLDQNADVPPDGVVLSDVYTLLKKIGEGGSGRVYLARDNNLDILCAIKVLKILQERDQKRFLSEIKITAKLRHSNIINIFYANHIQKYYYYVMEYVDGESSDNILKRKRFSEIEVLAIALPVAQAIEHAHKNNIIHRDIKPANIMIDKGGVAKICDMGLAMVRSMHTNPHPGSRIRGTPVYMSPEQITEAQNIDYRSDIYSFGVTLYHLLTRQLPFMGSNLRETLMMVSSQLMFPKNPRAIDPNISETMANLVLKCIQKKPEDRYQNMTDVYEVLQQIQFKSKASITSTLANLY